MVKRSAVSRFRTSFAPTTSWWWNDTLPPGSNRRVAGLPMSCSSAASRLIRSGRPAAGILQVDRLLQHGQAVLVDVLVPVVLVALQPQRGQLGQHPVGQTGRHQQVEPGPRLVGSSSLVSSSRTRSAETIEIRSAIAVIAATTSGRRPRSPAGRRTGPPASSAAGRR